MPRFHLSSLGQMVGRVMIPEGERRNNTELLMKRNATTPVLLLDYRQSMGDTTMVI